MKNASDLKRELDRINGRGYKSYKDLDINEGMKAVYSWRDLDKELNEEQDKTIEDLKKYCSLDAYGLVIVYKWLKNIEK